MTSINLSEFLDMGGKEMNKIYIAGKITGDPEYRAKFAAVEEMLERDPVNVVINPAVLPKRLDYTDYMNICHAMLNAADRSCFCRITDTAKVRASKCSTARPCASPMRFCRLWIRHVRERRKAMVIDTTVLLAQLRNEAETVMRTTRGRGCCWPRRNSSNRRRTRLPPCGRWCGN